MQTAPPAVNHRSIAASYYFCLWCDGVYPSIQGQTLWHNCSLLKIYSSWFEKKSSSDVINVMLKVFCTMLTQVKTQKNNKIYTNYWSVHTVHAQQQHCSQILASVLDYYTLCLLNVTPLYSSKIILQCRNDALLNMPRIHVSFIPTQHHSGWICRNIQLLRQFHAGNKTSGKVSAVWRPFFVRNPKAFRFRCFVGLNCSSRFGRRSAALQRDYKLWLERDQLWQGSRYARDGTAIWCWCRLRSHSCFVMLWTFGFQLHQGCWRRWYIRCHTQHLHWNDHLPRNNVNTLLASVLNITLNTRHSKLRHNLAGGLVA